MLIFAQVMLPGKGVDTVLCTEDIGGFTGRPVPKGGMHPFSFANHHVKENLSRRVVHGLEQKNQAFLSCIIGAPVFIGLFVAYIKEALINS